MANGAATKRCPCGNNLELDGLGDPKPCPQIQNIGGPQGQKPHRLSFHRCFQTPMGFVILENHIFGQKTQILAFIQYSNRG